MDDIDFSFYKKFLLERSGLSLGDDKMYLLKSRLTQVIASHKLASLNHLTAGLRNGRDENLSTAVIDAMTTNETSFFRDDKSFKYFRESLLPALLHARQTNKILRIWSAACSTGQEPYSIAMILSEGIPDLRNWKIEIVATDISSTVLDQARKGIFTQFEIQRGLPILMAIKHFRQEKEVWKINDEIRNMVRFEKFNLLDDMTRYGGFDIIFCRNVLIYFDQLTKNKVLRGLSRCLSRDGNLFVGGSETSLNAEVGLKLSAVCAGVFTPIECTEPAAVKMAMSCAKAGMPVQA